MNKHIKVSCFLAAVLTITMLFAGCTGIGKAISVKIPFFNTQELEPVKLSFCFQCYSSDGKPQNSSHIDEMLKELNKKTIKELNTEISFKWLPYDNYEANLKKLLKAGNGPDAYFTWDVRPFREDGLAMDITELLPGYAPKYSSLLKETKNMPEDSELINNKLYTVSNNDLIPPQYFVIARKDLVDKYLPGGISNYEDYDRFLQSVKENEKDIVPAEMNAYEFFSSYLLGNGYFTLNQNSIYSRWEAQDINPVFIEDSVEFKAASKLYKKWKEKDYLILNNNPESYAKLKKGELASVLLSGLQLHTPGFFPSGYNYCTYTLYPDSVYTSFSRLHTLALNSDSKNSERVLMFIEWLQSSQENYDLFMYGIKDKNYKLSGNKIDFSSFDNSYIIAGWEGSVAFRNYIYERPDVHEPENYKEFLEHACSKNTMTYGDIFESFGYDTKKYLRFNSAEKLSYEKLVSLNNELVDKRNKVYNEYLMNSDAGVFNKTLNEMMQDAGCNETNAQYVENYKKYLEMIRK